MKIKKIFSRAIAFDLISNGFDLVDTEKNRYKPWLSVFIFEENKQLLDKLTDITHKNI